MNGSVPEPTGTGAAPLVVDDVAVTVDGRGPRAVLMVHGWPDTAALWTRPAAGLADAMRCARFTLPGYAPDAGRAPRSPDAILALLGRIADAVSPDRPVDLLLHDWGCAFGYAFALEHPERVRRIVGVDVGDAGSRDHARSLRARDKAAIASYQLWLAAAWKAGGPAGDAMTRSLARAIGAPGASSTIGARMNWPYAMLWGGRFRAIARGLRSFDPPRPMLYVYGRRKPFMFHSPQWVDALERGGVHRAVGLDAGHWPMRDRPREFDALVRGWLADEPPGVPGPRLGGAGRAGD